MKPLILLQKIYQRLFLSHIQFARKTGVTIGDDCVFYSRNFGSEPYLITIGNHVQITDNVHFFTHGGGWVFRNKIPDLDIFGKIVIKDNVYIGSGTYILPGVTIESNVIVGARSVVTKSIPAGVIVAGNPATIIGEIENYEKKIQPFIVKIKSYSKIEKKFFLLKLSSDKFISKRYL